jgi:hypothetical protein
MRVWYKERSSLRDAPFVSGRTLAPSMRRPIPVNSFFCSFHKFFDFPVQPSRLCRQFPSALVVERFSLGASWVFSIQRLSFLRYEGTLGQDLAAVT